jgi:hypothetical protein
MLRTGVGAQISTSFDSVHIRTFVADRSVRVELPAPCPSMT